MPENEWGSRYLGWGFTALGIAGIVVGVAVVVLGFVVLGLTDDFGDGTAVVSDVLESTAEGIDTAQSILSAADEGLASVDDGMDDFRDGLIEFETALTDMSGVIGVDLADSFDALQQSFPGLIEVADVLDRTVEALAIFGIGSDSELTLGEAFRQMDLSLAEVPESLREQGRLLDEGRTNLVSVRDSLDQIEASLVQMQAEFAEAAVLFEEYRVGVDEARGTVGRTESDLDRWRPIAGWVLVIAGALMVLWQGVPLYLGARIRHRP
jgi:hypothetical protein